MSTDDNRLGRRLVWGGVVVLLILHQDVWFWNTYQPLVFGFIPIGLAYHAGISLAAGILWYLATRFAWPRGVDELESS